MPPSRGAAAAPFRESVQVIVPVGQLGGVQTGLGGKERVACALPMSMRAMYGEPYTKEEGVLPASMPVLMSNVGMLIKALLFSAVMVTGIPGLESLEPKVASP